MWGLVAAVQLIEVAEVVVVQRIGHPAVDNHQVVTAALVL